MVAEVNRDYEEELDHSVSLEPLAKVILHIKNETLLLPPYILYFFF